MRSDGGASSASTNGRSEVSNGLTPSPLRKAAISGALNGQSPTYGASNGQSHPNGSTKSTGLGSTYFGHNREEVTRILIQSLYDLDYASAAATLSRESGYELESPPVVALRSAVLDGQWAEAENILLESFRPDGGGDSHGGNSSGSQSWGKLLLAENANINEMLFCLRQQKYLELLEAQDLGAALMVLRQELAPLNHNIAKLHALSSLLMCPTEHLRKQSGWDGSIGTSRERLLSELSKSISPSVMIPDHRLAVLLDHVKQDQINQCLYHNTSSPPSLYCDHHCDRSDFPLHPTLELKQHSDEVWYVKFSHDGSKLVTTSKDTKVYIWETSTFTVTKTLSDHDKSVTHATWSPDDTKLITCSLDNRARVWSVETGHCLLTINQHREPVTAAAWAADGESFVTSSLDDKAPLCHWSIRGRPVYTWPGGYRVYDCAITPDGRRLIAIEKSKIHVYNLQAHEEEYCVPLKSPPTSITISRDSRNVLVNLAEGQINLIDIETSSVIRRFRGQKQGQYVIRSAFGGAEENFVISGSEDSCIYIWHRGNSSLVEALDGHVSGCVTSVSWNPADPGMFASVGDDTIVRIWTRDAPTTTTATSQRRLTSSNGFTRTSALRSTTSL